MSFPWLWKTLFQGSLENRFPKILGNVISKALWKSVFQGSLKNRFPRLFGKPFSKTFYKSSWQTRTTTWTTTTSIKVIPKTPIHYATRGQKWLFLDACYQTSRNQPRFWSLLQPLKRLEFWYEKGFQHESNTKTSLILTIKFWILLLKINIFFLHKISNSTVKW